MDANLRRFSAAAERNRGPLLEVLLRVLPPAGRALEIASGTGQHVAWFARHLARWRWQPTDADAGALASIAAWCRIDPPAAQIATEVLPLPNVEPPIRLDVLESPWPLQGRYDAILCANMLHIAPWDCCTALMQGAARHLAPGGRLVTYGPYAVDGEPLAPGNATFDADLRERDARWGLRLVGDVAREAGRAGLVLRERVPMPANNLTLIFEEAPA